MLIIVQVRAHVNSLRNIRFDKEFVFMCRAFLDFHLSKVGQVLISYVWVHRSFLKACVEIFRLNPPEPIIGVDIVCLFLEFFRPD